MRFQLYEVCVWVLRMSFAYCDEKKMQSHEMIRKRRV
jgi:hypothetical protein